MKKVLVVGSGISGATMANKLAVDLQKEVLVIEKNSHIAGNCYDSCEEGVMVHQYGAHLFHTSHKDVYEFLQNFTEFNNYRHEVKAYIDGKLVPIPFNFNSIDTLFTKEKSELLKGKLLKNYKLDTKVPILELRKIDDSDLNELAEFIYENVFLHYTLKQWGLRPDELDKSISGRVPIYIGTNDFYFPSDKYQGNPVNGYTAMITNMLEHKNITVKLNIDYKDIDSSEFSHIFYTGTIDKFFDYKYGKLPYRSEYFDKKVVNKEYFQSNSVINYPDKDNGFTRVIEHKYFLNDKTDKTVISYEYPQEYIEGKNSPYYPINMPKNMELYTKYLNDAKKLQNITFFGRLGDYRYYDMDGAVKRALNIFEKYKEVV